MPMAPEPTTSRDFGKLRHHRFLVGPDQLAVGLEPGKRRARAPVAMMMCLASNRGAPCRFAGRPRSAFPCKPRRPVDHRDLVLLHQIGDAVRKPSATLRLRSTSARGRSGHCRRQPKLSGVPHRVIELGGAQQRLGRDAAPIQADAAEMLALDDRGLQAKLCGADRGDIAAGTRADHGNIEAMSVMRMTASRASHQHGHRVFDKGLEGGESSAPSAPSITR